MSDNNENSLKVENEKENEKQIFISTPLIYSLPLSELYQQPIYLKLDNLQPSGSFKLRGIGHLCLQEYKKNKNIKEFIASSGGNAGLAVAYSALKLGLKATVIIPTTSSPIALQLLQKLKANVIQHGDVWADADKLARELAKNQDTVYIPPFDHPDIWHGNSSMIDEIYQQYSDKSKPAGVICAVGGGGLLCGIASGLERVGWVDIPIITSETDGAQSFNAAINAGHLVTLDKITSIAKTLGASCVCEQAFEWSKKRIIQSYVVSDTEAVDACLKFASDHRFLVEPSCGAALALLYSKKIEINAPIIIIVCGGSLVSIDFLIDIQKQLL
eukprot:TRINITY_DN363_c5_g1_i1.p1 TRINITY_DN363_c5_g1~~TRINITY_DN363_c5_g1_i1.p1  ORF type:complete len:329 (-),score=175.07 TRINITY_DN363_c5_g1_i1:80-1066(-)